MVEAHTLSLADLDAFDEKPIVHGSERRYLCPLASLDCQSKPRDDAHRCLCANTSSGLWNCKRCKASGKMREHWDEAVGKTFRAPSRRDRSRRELHNRFAVNVAPAPKPADPTSSAAGKFNWLEAWEAASLLPKLDEMAEGHVRSWLAQGARYIIERGISLETARAAGVRFCADWCGGRAVLFPLHDFEGRLVAVQGRYIHAAEGRPKTRTFGPAKEGAFITSRQVGDATGNPRYLSAWEIPALILCEGPFDALALAEAGYAAVAMVGTVLPTWLYRRAAFKPVLIASDADKVGDEAAEVWRLALAAFAGSCERMRPPLGKDWNEALLEVGVGSLADLLAWHVLLTKAERIQHASPDGDCLPDWLAHLPMEEN